MSRVLFSAPIASITGKLAGSVFQLSYGGFQLRSKVSPRNPRVARQQNQRMSQAFIAASWRDLTPTERQSWIDGAPVGFSGFNFFVQSNRNLSLIGLALQPTFTSSSIPADFGMSITGLSHTAFNIAASGPLFVVPSDTILLVKTSRPLSPAFSFVPQSWIVDTSIFASGVNLTVPTSILSDYFNAHGSIASNERIFLSSCLINTTNGLRGNETRITEIST